MELSILPVFVAFIFIFCIAITRWARSNESIKASEARSVYALLLSFFAWTLVAIVLGENRGVKSSLLTEIEAIEDIFFNRLFPFATLSGDHSKTGATPPVKGFPLQVSCRVPFTKSVP